MLINNSQLVTVKKMINKPIISHYQAKKLLAIPKHSLPYMTTTSIDLGITFLEVYATSSGVIFSPDCTLTWLQLKKISKSKNGCFILDKNTFTKIQFFSEVGNFPFSLMPTNSAPTMLIAGKTMHRIVNTDPIKDTETKIDAIAPITGRILDTSTGLGYTAIYAARSAEKVITIEIDRVAQKVAKLNPWSQELFSNPKITQLIGDSAKVIQTFPDFHFDMIIHDPPTFTIAGHLYSATYYSELYRILKNNGKLFHYIGNPNSASGDPITRGVIERLSKSGFKMIERNPLAFGVIARRRN